ncbi:MAG: hypothetical protein J1E16_01555 [Muribaculaceae bacterium]|nr:hypothetical protein [Muribaculaceae bacterium]
MTQVVLSIPNEEVNFIKMLAKKMGWKFEKKEDILNKFISSVPNDLDISEDEIQDAVNEIRYSK